MRRTGFTLLETVIAMGLAVVLLGASISARRFAIQSGQLAESKTTMTSLVNQSIETMRLVHDEYPNNWSAAGMFNLPSTGSSQNVVMYDASVSAGGSQQLSFCVLTNPVSHCSPNTLLPVAKAAGANQVSYLAYEGNNVPPAEIIAVKQVASAGGQNIIDSATLPSSAFPAGYPITPSTAGYSLYYRQITITREADAAGAVAGTTTPYGYYMVTVQVWPYGQTAGNTANSVTRTTFFADQPDGVNPL